MELAQLLDSEVGRLKRQVGQVGDIRLLLMAGLTIADKLSEALRHIEALQDEIGGLRDSRMANLERNRLLEEQLAERLLKAAGRMEDLSQEYNAGNEPTL